MEMKKMRLTSKRETPEVADVDEPDEECQACYLPAFEKQAVTLESQLQFLHGRQRALLVTGAEQLGAAPSRLVYIGECLEVLQRDSAFPLVDFGNVLENFDSFSILAAIDEELWRFLEVEDDKSQEEDEQRDCTKCEHQVAPTHVVPLVTAWLAGWDDIARLELVASVRFGFGEVGAAGVVRNEAISDRAADRDTDGLEDGEQGEHEPPVLRDELKADRRINGDITSDAEPIECGDNEEGAIRAAAAKTETECRAYEAGEVEGPLTACEDVRSIRTH
jgi:hypothetical protein